MSDSLGLVDFAVGLENSVFNFPNEQMTFFFLRNSNNRRTFFFNCEINSASQKVSGAS